jgi:hypothetical protein
MTETPASSKEIGLMVEKGSGGGKGVAQIKITADTAVLVRAEFSGMAGRFLHLQQMDVAQIHFGGTGSVFGPKPDLVSPFL